MNWSESIGREAKAMGQRPKRIGQSPFAGRLRDSESHACQWSESIGREAKRLRPKLEGRLRLWEAKRLRGQCRGRSQLAGRLSDRPERILVKVNWKGG